MTIRQTEILRKFNPTLNPKKDTSIFIACYVFREIAYYNRGMWMYHTYYFRPNKRPKMIKRESSYYETIVPMTALQRYGLDKVYERNIADGSKVPKSILNEINNQLQNDLVNWLDLEKSWINKHVMQAMKAFYKEK